MYMKLRSVGLTIILSVKSEVGLASYKESVKAETATNLTHIRIVHAFQYNKIHKFDLVRQLFFYDLYDRNICM